MCTPYIYHEELLSLDITPNLNSLSRLFLILLDPKSFQTALDYSSLYHMTSRSHALPPLQTNNYYYCSMSTNPNLSISLFTLLSYNNFESWYQQLNYEYIMLQLRNLSVGLGEEPCIGFTQENSIENSVQDGLSYIQIPNSLCELFLTYPK